MRCRSASGFRETINECYSVCRKTLDYQKMGSQGRSPRQGLGAVAPEYSPFPGERGLGIGIINQKFNFKNSLFIQAEQSEETQAVFFISVSQTDTFLLPFVL